MALIANQVVADAARAAIPNKLFFSKLGGIVIEDNDLRGLGAGNKKIYTDFELSNQELQVLNRGDRIETDELGQTQYEVTIEHLALGKKYFDVDTKYNISGGSIDDEAVRHLSGGFAQGLDNLALASLTSKSVQVDAGAGLTGNAVLDEALKQYGEDTFDGGISALVIHPTKMAQLRNDPNFEPVSNYTPTYGAQEVGRLGGAIPVVILNKVLASQTAGQYKNILVPKNSVLSVIGSDLNVERERLTSVRATEITGDLFVGFAATKAGIVFEG